MRTRTFILLIVLATAAFPVWYAFTHGYRSKTSYTCVRCRAFQHVTTFFGHESFRVEETDYSSWFSKRQLTHTHQWGWSGTIITHYPIGYARGCGQQHPAWQIPPEIQKAFVATATVERVEQFYTAMDSPDGLLRVTEMLFPSTATNTVSANSFE